MLLTGTFHRSLDEKLRFAIPKPIREALGHPKNKAIFVAPGTDGSLALYTEETFTRLAERLEESSPTGQDVRAYSRLFYAQAQRVEMDRTGRIRLPADLAALARIGKEIVLIGVRDHLELWNRNHWEEYLENKQQRYDELAENAFRLGGETRSLPANESSTDARPSLPR